MVPKKSFKLRRCSNYRKSNYRESTVCCFRQSKRRGKSFILRHLLLQNSKQRMIIIQKELQPF